MVEKLPKEYQDQFDAFVVSNPTGTSDSKFDRFWTFLQSLHTRAEQAQLRDTCSGLLGSGSGANRKCPVCFKVGHPASSCPKRTGVKATINAVAAQVKSRADLSKVMDDARTVAGNCPLCNVVHMYKRKFPFGNADFPSVRLEACDKFRAMSPHNRALEVEKLKG